MPTIHTKPMRKYCEQDLRNAVFAVRTKKMSLNGASKYYNVPKTTIYKKCKHMVPEGVCTTGRKPVLGVETEERIYQYCRTMARCGFPLRKNDLLDTVQRMIKKNGIKSPFTNDRPGKAWFKAFLNRHKDLRMKYTEHHCAGRASVTRQSIENWFANLKSYLTEIGQEQILTQSERIFNADETAFFLNPSGGKFIGEVNRTTQSVNPNSEKDNISVMVNYNAKGDWAPIMPIYKLKKISNDIRETMPPGFFASCSDSGWMQGSTFVNYLSLFYQHCLQNKLLVENDPDQKVILFVDGHKSHTSLEASIFAQEHNIILYCLYPNSTHIIQPADLGVMAPLKIAWNAVCTDHQLLGQGKITNKTFGRLIKRAFDEVTKQTMENSFRASGLYPFDPQAVKYDNLISEQQQNANKATQDPTYKEIFQISTQVDSDVLCSISAFEFLLGERLLAQFIANRGQYEWIGSIELKGLFEFWRAWKGKFDAAFSVIEPLVGLASQYVEEPYSYNESLVDPESGNIVAAGHTGVYSLTNYHIENEEEEEQMSDIEDGDTHASHTEIEFLSGLLDHTTTTDEDGITLTVDSQTVELAPLVPPEPVNNESDSRDSSDCLEMEGLQFIVDPLTGELKPYMPPEETEIGDERNSIGSNMNLFSMEEADVESNDTLDLEPTNSSITPIFTFPAAPLTFAVDVLETELRIPLKERNSKTKPTKRLNFAVTSENFRQENYNRKRKIQNDENVSTGTGNQCVYCKIWSSTDSKRIKWLQCSKCDDHLHYRCISSQYKKKHGNLKTLKQNDVNFLCEECSLNVLT